MAGVSQPKQFLHVEDVECLVTKICHVFCLRTIMNDRMSVRCSVRRHEMAVLFAADLIFSVFDLLCVHVLPFCFTM